MLKVLLVLDLEIIVFLVVAPIRFLRISIVNVMIPQFGGVLGGI
jgi:hypothetical protein